MSRIVAAVGESGKGKSTAGRNLDPEKTFWINVSGKDLPFRGWASDYTLFEGSAKKKSNGKIELSDGNGGNYYITADSHKITAILEYIDENRPEIEVIVIDDYQYIMSTEFMNRAQEQGWDKFNDIGKHAWDVINTAKNLRNDLTVFVTFHSETITENYKPKEKIKTIGKMVDDKVTLEGLFTIVLWADMRHDSEEGENEYFFKTQSDGVNTAKSPMGMFNFEIPNDFKYVLDQIEEYNKG